LNPKGYRITGTTTSNNIKVEPDVTTDITLDNVSVTSNSGTKNCMDVSHANVTITLVGNNLLSCGTTAYGALVKDGMDDSRLIIQSEHADEKGHTCSEGTCGKLRAEGTVEHATAIRNITSNRTIGSEAGFSNLTIRGGKNCAGIGGGRATPADGIYITGGTVYASGGALRSRQSRILRWINILLWLFRPVPG